MADSHAAGDTDIGALIGTRYRIDSLIGRGGMAAVYRARDESLGRSVALKLFAPNGAESEALKREASEIRLLASMNHHALVTLFDASVDVTDGDERAFLVMELVDGPTLQTRIASGPVDTSDVALMTVDLAEALHVVHAQGVVHRDIKPGNILLSPSLSTGREFRAKLADFGIAYLIDSTRLTTPGTLIGTAAYLSPEQANGAAPGPAADIYSLGLVLLEALTRERAYPGTLIESLTARLLRGPEIPGSIGYEWKSLLTAMTAMDPAARPTALEVVDAARQLSELVPVAADATAALDDTAALVHETGNPTAVHDAPTAPFGSPAAPLNYPTAVLPTAATTALNSAPTNTAPTAVLSSAYPAARDAPTAPSAPVRPANTAGSANTAGPATPSNKAQRSPGAAAQSKSRRSTTIRLVVVALVLVIAITVGLILWFNATSSTAPDLPNIDGDLGTHLNELMERVTP